MPVVALVGGTLGGEPIRIDVGCDRASTDLTRSCNLQRPRGILWGCLYRVSHSLAYGAVLSSGGGRPRENASHVPSIGYFRYAFRGSLSAVAKEADHAL